MKALDQDEELLNTMRDPDPAAPAADAPAISPERAAELAVLEGKLDVRFRDRALLNLALQHGSFGHEGRGGRRESYERLELLGDAVLNLVVCDHLYQRYSEAAEGELAKTMYEHGRSLMRRDKKMPAARKLQQAMVIFTRLGMVDDAAKAAEAQLMVL